jgi:hypothetical protein
MPSVSILFRKSPSRAESPVAAAGEVVVCPQSENDRDRLDLAALVLEQGLDGLITGKEPIKSVVVPLGPNSPTLDDMLAATFAARLAAGQEIPSGAKSFARYSAVLRKGLRPGKIPAEVSLEGIFLAIRNSVADDLTDPKAAAGFLAGWFRMFERILTAAEKNEDPFSTALFGEGADFAEERAFLVKDRNVYRQDVQRGRQWVARLPSESLGPAARPSAGKTAPNLPRSSALILESPKSLLFKYWARIDRSSPTGEGYLLLGVCEGQNTWTFSTDPAQRLSLKSLADRLQQAEEKEVTDSREARTDPWFDGDRFAHTLIASPRRGTCLPQEKVLGVVKQWAHAAPPRTEIRKFAIPAAVACLALLVAVPWLPALWRPSEPVKHARGEGNETSARGDTAIAGASAADFNPEKGKLLVLSIGADYKKRDVVENACKKDAEKLAAAFQNQQGVFFKHVSVTTLLNNQAKKDAILSKLDEIRKEATDGDLVIVTLAGHGTVDQDNNYFFLPFDYDPTKVLPSTGVSWDDFHRVFRPLHCMVLVIADTCHSGAITQSDGARDADEDAMQDSINKAVNDFRQAQAGLIVIAGSLAEGLAKQNKNYGYLSQAVYEGVTGDRTDSTAHDEYWPKPNSDGLITLETLRSYVINRVQSLSHKSQKVVTNHSGNIHLDDIPIAIRRTASTAAGAGARIAEPQHPSP